MPHPAHHLVSFEFEGPNHTCVGPSQGKFGVVAASDRFYLREARRGHPTVDLRPTGPPQPGCFVEVHFDVPGVRASFTVIDATRSWAWGPMGYVGFPTSDWRVAFNPVPRVLHGAN
jgi:hypothetical protein